jgi:carbamoyl-phosphate synthase large subunit
MTKRLLVTSAGTGPSNNLIRSLRAGDPSVVIIGSHHDPFILKGSAADRQYLVPSDGHAWARALRRIASEEAVDLIIPATDADTLALSRTGSGLARYLFLPRPTLVELCADKYRLARRLRALGLPAPATARVRSLRDVDAIFRRLAGWGGAPLWCRVRRGAGSRGAIPVATAAQARSWIAYWRDMRGVPVTAFTLSEYLPGRDLGCQSVWKDGTQLLVKTYERLSYLTSGAQPAEISSVPALTKTVREPEIAAVCARVIRALDPRASGVFGVDLRQDAGGVARVTEINAGRFSSTTNLLDLTGKHNMTVVYLQAALGERIDLRDEYDAAEYHYLLRDIDAVPRILREEEFFEGVVDARQPTSTGKGPTC